MKLTAAVSPSDQRKLVSRLRDVERKQMAMPRQPRLVHRCIWEAPLKAGMEDLAVTTGASEASALSAVRVRWAEGNRINEVFRTGRVRLFKRREHLTG